MIEPSQQASNDQIDQKNVNQITKIQQNQIEPQDYEESQEYEDEYMDLHDFHHFTNTNAINKIQRNTHKIFYTSGTEATLMYIKNQHDNLNYVIDPGSFYTIIPKNQIKNQQSEIQPNLQLVAANNQIIQNHGLIKHKIKFKSTEYEVEAILADVNEPLLGLEFFSKNNLSINPAKYTITNNTSGEIYQCNKNIAINKVNVKELINEFEKIDENRDKPIEKQISCHHIQLNSNRNVVSKQHYYNPELSGVIAEHFKDLEARKIVRPSKLPFASPITVVKKSNGKIRVCGDYRMLNAVTIHDNYPLPNIQHINYRLRDCKIFSKLDLKEAFYSIPMNKPDIYKTAVLTPIRLYEFCKMPFGLRNSAQTFQRYMNSIFNHQNNAISYVDDIIIYSKNEEEHKIHLMKTVKLIKQHGLEINYDKSEFFRHEISYLSYRINENGITLSNEKYELFKSLQIPKTIGELRRFIGLANYFARFMPYFLILMKPLYAIKPKAYIEKRSKANESKISPQLKAKASRETIALNEEQKEAFEKSKDVLLKQITLKHPIINSKKIVEVDSSKDGFGAALYQVNPDTNLKELIFLTSGTFPTLKRNRTTYDFELEGAYRAVKQMRKFLEGNINHLFTDNMPLVHNLTNPKINIENRELHKLATINQLITKVIHIQGKKNGLADFLSRYLVTSQKETNLITAKVNNIYLGKQINYQQLANQQKEDQFCKSLSNNETYKYKPIIIGQLHLYLWFKKTNDNKMKIIVPESMQQEIVKIIHATYHPGTRTTTRLISEQFYFKKMVKLTRLVIKHCNQCQRAKITKRNKVKKQRIETNIERFSTVHIDLVGPLYITKNLNEYMLTMLDRSTRYLIIVPVKQQTTEVVIDVHKSIH